MDWGITLLDELQRMKKKMDQTWSELFKENSGREQGVSQRIEKLPKFEGTRRTRILKFWNLTASPSQLPITIQPPKGRGGG
jgi:hypothetical protein